MIQIIARFDEIINYILNMNWLYISIIIEKFNSCDFIEKSGQIFHSNEHKCIDKTTFC
jgi:hypothetical protein